MNQITIDAEFQKRIGEITGLTRLVDEAGNLKGFLLSAELRSLIYEWAKSQFPAVESRIPGTAKKYYTTKEAIARMETLDAALRGEA